MEAGQPEKAQISKARKLTAAGLVLAAAACAVAGLCGERAAAATHGPGSFKAAFLDALYLLSPETLRAQEV